MRARFAFALLLAATAAAPFGCARDEEARTDIPAAAAPASTPVAAAEAGAASDAGGAPAAVAVSGADIYAEHKCALCHAIAGVGNEEHPLDGVGARLTREAIRKWIVAPREMDPKVRKPAFAMPEDDLSALVEYLATLEAPRPN